MSTDLEGGDDQGELLGGGWAGVPHHHPHLHFVVGVLGVVPAVQYSTVQYSTVQYSTGCPAAAGATGAATLGLAVISSGYHT